MNTFYLPDLGEGLHEAVLLEWYAYEGSTLKQGDVLVAVETAKAVVEIPAPEDLKLEQFLAKTGEIIHVGAALFAYSTQTSPVVTDVKPSSVSVVGELSEATSSSQRPFILGSERFSPAEIALAQQQLQATTARSSIQTMQTTTPAHTGLSGSRHYMSQQLSRAWHEVALVTIMDEAYIRWPKQDKTLARLLTALCDACRQEPKLNAHFHNHELTPQPDVHIGLAVDTSQGLFVPVLAYAQQLTAEQRYQQAQLLIQQTRHGEIASAAQKATISLSNFGSIGGRWATPLVVPPQVAILGVGKLFASWRSNKKGQIKATKALPLSLSFDHRALTGGEAARFLAAVKQSLEQKH